MVTVSRFLRYSSLHWTHSPLSDLVTEIPSGTDWMHSKLSYCNRIAVFKQSIKGVMNRPSCRLEIPVPVSQPNNGNIGVVHSEWAYVDGDFPPGVDQVLRPLVSTFMTTTRIPCVFFIYLFIVDVSYLFTNLSVPVRYCPPAHSSRS